MNRPILFGGFAVALIGLSYLASWNLRSPGDEATTPVTWVAFTEGMTKAQAENKKVLLSVYTDWCTWCKKMDSEVYTDAQVEELLNEKFVAIKLNAESSKTLQYDNNTYTNADFSRALGISGYPATVFFGSDTKPITLLPGYVDADRFATILRYIGEDHYLSTSFEDYIAKASQVD
jgi:thioredoxin-related protein